MADVNSQVIHYLGMSKFWVSLALQARERKRNPEDEKLNDPEYVHYNNNDFYNRTFYKEFDVESQNKSQFISIKHTKNKRRSFVAEDTKDAEDQLLSQIQEVRETNPSHVNTKTSVLLRLLKPNPANPRFFKVSRSDIVSAIKEKNKLPDG